MLVTCCIPTRGHFDYAKIAVRSFLEHTPNSFAFIVDDATSESETPSDIFDDLPSPNFRFTQFLDHGGLTRSWNTGLLYAHEEPSDYHICGNSDLIFTPGWFEPIMEALNGGFSLVGPL